VHWVVLVLFAVVFPAVELEVVEAGGSAVGPVGEVVGVAVGGRSGAAGGLAVSVAGDERVPQGGGDGAGGAADVEDLGFPGHDHPADVRVTRDAFEGRGAEVPVAADLETEFLDPFGCGEVFDVDRDDEVAGQRTGGGGFGADRAAADEVHERVGAALRGGAGVAGGPVAFHLGVESTLQIVGVVGIEQGVEGTHPVERFRQVGPSTPESPARSYSASRPSHAARAASSSRYSFSSCASDAVHTFGSSRARPTNKG
jgi:hypothetical protein